MAGEWVKRKIGSLGRVVTGKTPPTADSSNFGGPYPFITIPDLDGHVLIDRTERTLSEKGAEILRSCLLPPGSVMMSCIATVGRCGITTQPSFTNQQINSVIPNDEVDSRFLYYVFTQLGHELESAGGGGSVYTNVSKNRFSDIEVLLPADLSEQRAIAHILGTLDDKIELNRRMSETLEQMARALFKAWFVDFEPVRAKMEGRDPGLPQPLADLFPDSFEDSELGEIPKGWGVGPLGRFFAVGLGGVWGEDEQSARASVEVRCLRGIDCHDLAEGRIPDVPVRWVSPKQAADRHMSDGTVLIEGSGSFCGRSMIWRRGYGELLGEPVVYSNFCKRLDPLCTAAQATVCWMLMRQAYRDGLLQSFRTGTAFPNFDVHGALSNVIVAVPPAPVADVFNRLFGLSQRLDLMAQTRTLAALRDALLPKLISGELRVKDAERFLKEQGL